MPYINLIEEQRLSERQTTRQSRAFLLSFVGITVASLMAVGFLFLQAESAQAEEAKLLREKNKLEPLLKQIDRESKELNELKPKLATLTEAREATMRWSRILDHISRNIPGEAWLTNIRCNATDPTKPVQMSVTGMSGSQEIVGEILTRLTICSDLENVNLKFTQERQIERGKGIEFEITGEVAGTAEKKSSPKDEQKEAA